MAHQLSQRKLQGNQGPKYQKHQLQNLVKLSYLLRVLFTVYQQGKGANVDDRRVTKIIKADKDIAMCSKEAVFLISVAAVRPSYHASSLF